MVGHYVCGESVDVLNNLFLVGSYTSEKYLSVFDQRNFKELDNIKWDSEAGKGGFIYSCKFIRSNTNKFNYILAGSSHSNDFKIY